MPRLIKRCTKCGRYTLNPNTCPHCGAPVASAHPPKYSIEDRYGKYRRAMKKALLAQQEACTEK